MMNLGMGAMPWDKGFDMRQMMTGAPGVGPMPHVAPTMQAQPPGLMDKIMAVFGNKVPQTGGPEQPGGLLGLLAGPQFQGMMGNKPPPPMPMLGLLQNPNAGRAGKLADTYGGML